LANASRLKCGRRGAVRRSPQEKRPQGMQGQASRGRRPLGIRPWQGGPQSQACLSSRRSARFQMW
jgi:hypothetical protein